MEINPLLANTIVINPGDTNCFLTMKTLTTLLNQPIMAISMQKQNFQGPQTAFEEAFALHLIKI